MARDLEHVERSGVELVSAAAARRGDDSLRLGLPYVFTSLLTGDDGADVPAPFEWLGRRVHSVAQTPQVLFDLHVMRDGRELVLDLDSLDDMFPAGVPAAVFNAMVGLLERVADEPRAWSEPPLGLLPDGQDRVRRDVDRTDALVPSGGCTSRVARVARERPDAVAVRSGVRAMTYGDLDRAAERVALVLDERDVGCGDLVGIAMHRGWEQVAAVLGVHRAGAAYVPIDPDLPLARRRELVARAGVRTVLTQPALVADLDLPETVAVLAVEDGDGAPRVPRRERPCTAGDDLAYVIFTSGSTGAPKGVEVTHQAALNTVLDINARLGVDHRDAVLAVSSLSFDLSVYDVFGPLAAGATVVLPDADRGTDPAHRRELSERHRVTLWNSVPALYGLYLGELEARGTAAQGSLRHVLLSGDWIPVTLPGRSRAVAPGAALLGKGGATEAAIWSIAHPIARPLLILRLEQACADRRRRQGPTAADAVALRAILDSAAYLDAPTSRRGDAKEKDQEQERGVDR